MSGVIVPGSTWTSAERDKEGHRTYKVKFKVQHDPLDGPVVVSNTPGLPVPGSFWNWGNDVDSYAFCYWATSLKPEVADETNTVTEVECTFSTRPENKFCRKEEVENPLLEPPKISGSFSKYTEEAVYDRFGQPITNSAWERVRGPTNEWDKNRLSIKIEQNVGTPELGYQLPAQFMDCVNAFPMWGFPPRTIKLSAAPWEAKYWGDCAVYYTRTLEFEIRYTLLADGVTVETWDRDLYDEATAVLHGHFNQTTNQYVLDNIAGAPPNPRNPMHFDRSVDTGGNPKKIMLNGHGIPAGTVNAINSYFVSIQDSNEDNNLVDSSWWLPTQGVATPAPDWEDDEVYNPGEIVNRGGFGWVCRINAGTIVEPGTDAQVWIQLNAFPPGPTPRFTGMNATWSATTSYALGDLVIDGSDTIAAGKIHVEKYMPVDLTLLDIPLSF